MKYLNAKTLAALALTGAMSIGTASAMGLDSGTRSLGSVIGVSSPTLSYKVQDGVATLFGNAESGFEAELAEAHVEKISGVDHVINLITYN